MWRKIHSREAIRARRESEAGQALVELGFTLALLIVPMLLGAIEFARVAYAGIEVSNAAKAAVQYGAQDIATSGDNAGMSVAATNEAADIAATLTTASSYSCVCSDGTPSTCQSTDCSSSNIETIVTVTTQTTVNPLIHLPGFPSTYTLYGHASQKVGDE